MKIRILIILLTAFLFGCDGNQKPPTNDPLANFKPNKAELGESWKQFKHDSSFQVWVFTEETRPQEHKTPQGARVFWNGDVTPEELSIIDDGLTTMLTACRQDHPDWIDAATGKWKGNIWTKFPYFQKPSDFKIIFVKSNYTLQEGESRGCAGMITGAGGTITTAGTVGGMIDKFNSTMPASQGGIYLIIPKQSAEQLAKSECKTLIKNAIRHESEHIWLSNDTGLYFAYANDTDPTAPGGHHPYCRPMK